MSLTLNSLFLISFLDLFAISLIVPLLSAHLRSLGASHILIGFASSIYALLQLFCGPIAGSWSDIKGRKPVLMASLLVCSVCYYSLGFASHIFVIIFIRIALGTMKHIQSLCKAIITDVVHKDDLTKVLGRCNAFSGLGFIVGPAIGGNLAELKHGFHYVCSLTTLIYVVNTSIAYLLVPKTNNEERKSSSTPITVKDSMLAAVNHLRSMDWVHYWDSFISKFMLALSLSLLYSNFSLLIQERFSVTPSVVGYIISFQSILGAISGFGVGSVSSLYNQRTSKLTQHGFMVLALFFLLIAASSSLGTFLIALAPVAAISSILRTSLSQWSLERSPSNQKGSVLGAQHSLSAMARMSAPLIAGVAQATLGSSGPCILAFCTSLIGFYMVTIMIRRELNTSYGEANEYQAEIYSHF